MGSKPALVCMGTYARLIISKMSSCCGSDAKPWRHVHTDHSAFHARNLHGVSSEGDYPHFGSSDVADEEMRIKNLVLCICKRGDPCHQGPAAGVIVSYVWAKYEAISVMY